MIRMPTVSEVAKNLVGINKYDGDEDEGIDVRLQVYEDGQWAVRFGSSDYDQDHRGFWGSSSVPGSRKRFNSRAVAADLIDQCEDMASQNDYEVRRKSPAPRHSR